MTREEAEAAAVIDEKTRRALWDKAQALEEELTRMGWKPVREAKVLAQNPVLQLSEKHYAVSRGLEGASLEELYSKIREARRLCTEARKQMWPWLEMPQVYETIGDRRFYAMRHLAGEQDFFERLQAEPTFGKQIHRECVEVLLNDVDFENLRVELACVFVNQELTTENIERMRQRMKTAREST